MLDLRVDGILGSMVAGTGCGFHLWLLLYKIFSIAARSLRPAVHSDRKQGESLVVIYIRGLVQGDPGGPKKPISIQTTGVRHFRRGFGRSTASPAPRPHDEAC